MKYLAIAIFALASAFALPSYAQSKPAGTDMQILRDKLKADKKLVVADNMQLSEAEAKAFWPIYEEYQQDLQKINQRTLKMIQSYAEAYNKKTLTNDTARKLTDEMLSIESAEAAMHKTYAGKLGKSVSAITTARYLQIENKIRAMIRLELAANIPLIP